VINHNPKQEKAVKVRSYEEISKKNTDVIRLIELKSTNLRLLVNFRWQASETEKNRSLSVFDSNFCLMIKNTSLNLAIYMFN